MEENHGQNGSKYISLQPFIHQVGGHSSMLCLDEATVCKPVVRQEQLFYETLPAGLKAFVPSYYGTVRVKVVQDGDYISLSATSPDNYDPKPTPDLKHCRLRLRKNGSIEVEGVPTMFEGDPASSDVSAAVNPWVLKCHKEYITGLLARNGNEPLPLNFIMLENLTWKFSLPCILDLKMGTRQYGDDDSLAKRQSKMVKVITTTSAKLGVRIGGMQVFQASTGRYLCRNKLYGRTLSVAGFQKAVRGFLHDGVRLRLDALPPLIQRLEELHSTLSQIGSLRLYTTSLLLLYEGRHCHTESVSGRVQELRTPKSTEEEARSTRASSLERQVDSLSPSSDFRHRSASCNPAGKKQYRPQTSVEVLSEEPLTDVRLIDFAHSTHCGMEDSVLYSGPDNGFLFGLSNTIEILKSILMDYQ